MRTKEWKKLHNAFEANSTLINECDPDTGENLLHISFSGGSEEILDQITDNRARAMLKKQVLFSSSLTESDKRNANE